MKKYIIAFFLLCGTCFYSCQDQLEKEFMDPERYPAPESMKAAGMFAKMTYEWKTFVQDYGEWYYLLCWSIPHYAQISSFMMTSSWDAYWEDWERTDGGGFTAGQVNKQMYQIIERSRYWNIVKVDYENASEAEKEQTELYYHLMTMIKDYNYLRLVDLYNSLPYKNALRGYEGIFFAEYDDPGEIYTIALDNIKEATNSLEAAYNKLTDTNKAFFAKQDIVFKGEIRKWTQWGNALRLKHAVRISGVNEAVAKGHIQELLTLNNFPTEDFSFPVYTINQFQAVLDGGGETWVRGVMERYHFALNIPNTIMKRLNHGTPAYEPGIDDPRLPLLALQTRWGDYRGVQMNRNAPDNQPMYEWHLANVIDANRPAGVSDAEWTGLKRYNQAYVAARYLPQYGMSINYVSAYNNLTYLCSNFPAYIMSRAEVDLFLAEINLKNLGTTKKTAAEYIEDAFRHSTDFWYNIQANIPPKWSEQSSGVFASKDIKPAHPDREPEAVMAQYAAFLKQQYTDAPDKLEIIMQQKYVHLNLMGAYELWAELRRTRRPKLEPITTRDVTMAKPMIERITYHPDEPTKNQEAFKKVKDQNNYTSPIFWVADPNESYYRDTYID